MSKNMTYYLKYMVGMIDSDCFLEDDSDLWQDNSFYILSRRGVPRTSLPAKPIINNLDSLIHDIYLRYIALNDQDFENYYKVIHEIYYQIHQKMKKVDPYYNKYHCSVQFVGSHPDRLRIKLPDEFDINLVMNMPISFKNNPLNPEDSDFLLEPMDPGFIQLKMGVQYQRLPQRDRSEWYINKTAYQWKDSENYLLRSKVMDWFKSVVHRALNEFSKNRNSPSIIYVHGVPYTVRRSENGPALTLYIENDSKNFKADIDLVLGLRFPIDRWPICGSYRNVPMICLQSGFWMLVPKACRKSRTEQDKNREKRSWRIAMHEQERLLMHGTNNMKQAIRLMKKFRDAQNMDKIASYFIKTLFFWEVTAHEYDRTFWNNSPAFLFKVMLIKFHHALELQHIPFYWNKQNNLIEHIDRPSLKKYASTVAKLINILHEPSDYKQVAKYLLSATEFKEYNENFLHISKSSCIFNINKPYILLLILFLFFYFLSYT